MRIQLLNGGLGNQVFQYIFARFAERYHPGETWYLDDSTFFFFEQHNGYELQKVFPNIKVNLLSNYFDQDVWQEIIRLRKEEKLSLPQIFLNMGTPLDMIAETSDYSFTGRVVMVPANEFHPEITTFAEPNLYYHGYWINKQWFSTYKEEMMEELEFPELTDSKNIHYAKQITNSLSVGIHIRRGDFVNVGWALPPEYYQANCKNILKTYPDATFFVVTDDAVWCQEHEQELGLNLAHDTVYITGNMHGKNYIDMQLLSMCKGMILSNSSFCYLAALLDRNLRFWVNPTGREI